MQDLHSFVMPGWLEPASPIQQFSTLSLPILVAVLMVFAAKVLWDDDPRQQVFGLMVLDQRKLGYRRFTPARRWFSAFTLSLVEAQSVLRGPLPAEETIDLEVLDAESELLLGLGGYAESEEVRSLQGLVAHFRREMIVEAGSDLQPGLAETWVGYGLQRITGLGPLTKSETHLRIYNADDLGRQLIARTVTRGVAPARSGLGRVWPRRANSAERIPAGSRGFGRSERPVAFISVGPDEPSPAEVEASMVELESVRSASRGHSRLLRSLLEAGRGRSVQAPTSDDLVESIQGNSRRVGVKGKALAWTTDPVQAPWARSWTSTVVVSGGAPAELPLEGSITTSA